MEETPQHETIILPSFSKYSQEVLNQTREEFITAKKKDLAEQEEHIKVF